MTDVVPSLTEFRGRVRGLVEREMSTARPRPIVVLAVDGIPHALAAEHWRQAEVSLMRSVFPPTSSTAWLSSLTGAGVGEHGVPGVVFRLPDTENPVDVFEYRGPGLDRGMDNIFSDAESRGYDAWAVCGDLEEFECSWRDILLAHARRAPSVRFYSDPGGLAEAEILCERIATAVGPLLAGRNPCLVWCFVDVDRHVHRHGYDEHVVRFLRCLDSAAGTLAENGAVVLAHSDHGLVPTRHDRQLEEVLLALCSRYGCSLGGAGRTRWVYIPPGSEDQVHEELAREMPDSVRLAVASEMFDDEAIASHRVGELLLIAQEEVFITSPGYIFDHGSISATELEVPFAVWQA